MLKVLGTRLLDQQGKHSYRQVLEITGIINITNEESFYQLTRVEHVNFLKHKTN